MIPYAQPLLRLLEALEDEVERQIACGAEAASEPSRIGAPRWPGLRR